MSWPKKFMELAHLVSSWSKDRTKVGAVAVDDSNRMVETGYNGIPRGVVDSVPRMTVKPFKYEWMAHAEENLVAHAARDRLAGTTVYVTHLCCARCARMLINAGVKKVVYGDGETSMDPVTFDIAKTMFDEAGIELVKSKGGA